MIIKIDRNIYNDSCISKVVYILSDRFKCNRQLSDAIEHISIEPLKKDNPISEDKIETLFFQTLNDYKLREIIRVETKDINTILYLKAFADCDQLLEEYEE